MKLSRSIKLLSASSLIESIIAIVLISICSLVALTVYLNVIGQNNPISYYDAKHKIELLANQAEIQQNFEDDIYTYTNYSIEKNVTIKSNENLAIVDFIIKSGDKSYSVKKLISIEQEN